MKNNFTKWSLLFLLSLISANSFAQGNQIVGKVVNATNESPVDKVSVIVKGTFNGTTTDAKGGFKLKIKEFPVTLVFSSVGYKTHEIEMLKVGVPLSISLEEEIYSLGQDVVVSASRSSEKILESPVSIERVTASQIRESAAPNFYDGIANLKGVEVSTQSLTFKSVNTRGFNSNGNVRFNQFVDGMDNQAPGLNFSVGNILGLSDLDVDNVDLLPGTSSALYGAGGINGTMLMSSLSPFKKEGVSYMMKGGVNHVKDVERSVQPYKQVDLRLAKQWNQKIGVKAVVSYLEADDWRANDYRNFDRTARALKEGNRNSDPNYDGINVYGDEINQNMRGVNAAVMSATENGVLAATAGLVNLRNLLNLLYPVNVPTQSQYESLLARYGYLVNRLPLEAQTALRSYYPFYVGNRLGLVPDQYVSRTGYEEKNLVDYGSHSFKALGALHYKFTPNLEGIVQANWGTGTSVYTGADRFSLRNFNIGQYKIELKGSDFFLRAYTTREDAGKSYNATLLGTFINEGAKSSREWYPQYVGNYIGARIQGTSEALAHQRARNIADQGRLIPGSPQYNVLKDNIIARPIGPQNGAGFVDNTNLYHYEGMYDFSNLFKKMLGFQVGASFRKYDLNSNGTIFDDANRNISIDEYGSFAQLSKKILNDKLKLSVSGRFDKSQNFDGRFTPRASAVYSIAKDNNIRFSYQMGFRNPTTQNQYIDLAVGGGSIRLVGGLPEFLAKYQLLTNRPYTFQSYRDFQESAFQGTPNPALLKVYNFNEKGIKPESVNAYELGYKGLLGGKLLIDAYGYYNIYSNFITGVEVYQKNITATDPTGLRAPIKFNSPVNADGDVSSYGAAFGANYLLGKFALNGNVSYNEIGKLPANYINDFNTPKTRYVLGVANSQLIKNVGFSVNYRWQDQFMWNSAFVSGNVPAFGTVDAQLNLKIPSLNTMLKIGGSNILNRYYTNTLGNPAVGAVYYVGLTFN